MSAIPGLNPAPTRTPELTAPGLAPTMAHRPTWIRLVFLLALVAAGGWAGHHYLAKRQTQPRAPWSVAPRTARVPPGTVRRGIRWSLLPCVERRSTARPTAFDVSPDSGIPPTRRRQPA